MPRPGGGCDARHQVMWVCGSAVCEVDVPTDCRKGGKNDVSGPVFCSMPVKVMGVDRVGLLRRYGRLQPLKRLVFFGFNRSIPQDGWM